GDDAVRDRADDLPQRCGGDERKHQPSHRRVDERPNLGGVFLGRGQQRYNVFGDGPLETDLVTEGDVDQLADGIGIIRVCGVRILCDVDAIGGGQVQFELWVGAGHPPDGVVEVLVAGHQLGERVVDARFVLAHEGGEVLVQRVDVGEVPGDTDRVDDSE